MGRLLPVFLVCVAATTATADGFYVTESVGGSKVKDELAAYMDGALRIRFAAGVRRRNWAIEGFVASDPASSRDKAWMGIPTHPNPNGEPPCEFTDRGCDPGYGPAVGFGLTSLITYGIDVKYLQPLSRHFEIYLRGRISGAEMTGQLDGYGGRGLGVGAGLQLKGKVSALGLLWWPLFFSGIGPKVTAALFLDDGYDFYRLHPGGRLDAGPAVDAQLSHLTMGFAIGSDF